MNNPGLMQTRQSSAALVSQDSAAQLTRMSALDAAEHAVESERPLHTANPAANNEILHSSTGQQPNKCQDKVNFNI